MTEKKDSLEKFQLENKRQNDHLRLQIKELKEQILQ